MTTLAYNVYRLKQGNEFVYIGVTKDLRRREQEHRNEGKRFTSTERVSSFMTRESAKQKEGEMLAAYRRGHGGRNPKYNRDSDG